MKTSMRIRMVILSSLTLLAGCNSPATVAQVQQKKNYYPQTQATNQNNTNQSNEDTTNNQNQNLAVNLINVSILNPVPVAVTTHQFSVEICGNSKDDDGDGITDESNCYKSSWVYSQAVRGLTPEQLDDVEHACSYDITFMNGSTNKGRYHFAVTHDAYSRAPALNLPQTFNIAALGVVGNVDRLVVKTTRLGYARCGLRARTILNSDSWSHHLHDLERERDARTSNLSSTVQLAYINKAGTVDDTWTRIHWDGSLRAYTYMENQGDRQWVQMVLDSWID